MRHDFREAMRIGDIPDVCVAKFVSALRNQPIRRFRNRSNLRTY